MIFHYFPHLFLKVFVKGDLETLASAFTYNAVQLPTVASVSPSVVDICGNISITINGNNFISDGVIPIVKIGDKTCEYVSHDATSITCLTPDSEPSLKEISVHVPGVGKSKQSVKLRFKINVFGFFPRCGSIVGGTEVTVHGRRFCGNVNNTVIKICGVDCHVTSVLNSRDVKCVTQGIRKTVYIGNGGIDKRKRIFFLLYFH